MNTDVFEIELTQRFGGRIKNDFEVDQNYVMFEELSQQRTI